ncbi:MAG: cytochrome-c peroxidase [Leptospiraceae bacterium]|nr:cytochrome-c peroxidase [Leptospiraceae bacterium]MCP5499602.1 cytochrome-c peroxidase [Leptospiraceae bacterium]
MRISILVFSLFVFIINCGPSEKMKDLKKKAESFGAIPAKMPGSENDTQDLIDLGKKLFFEKKLSVNDTQSCNSCHDVLNKKGGVDNEPTSPGALGKRGDRNSPTVLNAGYHTAQFWDGRVADLIGQAKGPITNPIEMGMLNEAVVEEKITSIADYKPLFEKAFPKDEKKISYDNIAKAIAAFERTLKTNDRFDDFIRGDFKALTEAELKGFETFMAKGCQSCHNGPLFGGNSFRKLGQVKPYETEDLGRFNVSKKEEDKFVFKVPSLRNIALTAPYFHDGKVKTLEDAVKLMGTHQLGIELKDNEIKEIVTFLNSLTDKNKER